MELTWEELRRRLDRYDVDTVAALVSEASEPQRRAVAAELIAYTKQVPPAAWWRGRWQKVDGEDTYVPLRTPAGAVAVAAVGVLGSATQVAALLCWKHLRRHWVQVPVTQFLEVARARKVPWLGALAERLAASSGATNGYELVAALVIEAAIPPPTTDPFVKGWVDTCLRSGPDRLADRWRADPFLDAMLPRLFELDGLGSTLNMRGDRHAFVAALVELAEQGRLDRSALLDGCLARFRRGGRAAALRPFVDLHDALSPGHDELAARAEHYALLAPDAASTVARLAQRALRALDGASRLDTQMLLDVSGGVLRRTEKGLARAQLRWLDRAARGHADRAGEIVAVAAVAFAHPAADVQAQALSVVDRHLAAVDTAGRERLAAAAADLPADLRERAAVLLGVGVPAPDPVAVPVDLPGSAAAMPPPIASAAELAEQIDALIREPPAAVAWERALAGLVRVQARDPHGIVDALAPVLQHHRHSLSLGFGPSWRLFALLGEAVRATGPNRRRAAATARRNLRRGRVPRIRGLDGLRRIIAARVGEVRDLLATSAMPALLATPTSADGRLAAETIVERLAAVEAAGWQPAEHDLRQALLRLPREVDPEVITRARRLRSAAGARLAGWLVAGGLPDPDVTRFEQRRRRTAPWSHPPARRVQVVLTPARPPRSELERIMCVLHPRRMVAGHTCWPDANQLWPAVAPHHREVVAAWALPAIAAMADEPDGISVGPVLPLLAACAGPAGPAMMLAVTYGLAARQASDRSAAVRAMLALARAGDLDAAAVGRELGGLVADGVLKLGRVVGALAEATRAGAHTVVCCVATAALPAILATSSPFPHDTPDLLALATDAAATIGWRTPIPELDAALDRGGSGRLVTEARRLHRILAR